ncbi:MAG: Ig-like domain-containing protein, partial [archaeon]|nr:Ig-like domain-containing protein [archaeon]
MRTNVKMVIGLFAVLMIASSFAVTISSGDSAAETGDGSVFAADVRDLCDSVFGEGKIGIDVNSDVVTIHVNPSDITTVAADDDVKKAIKALVHDYKYIYVNGDSIVNNSKPDMALLLPLQIASAETFKSCELTLGDNEIITYDVKTTKSVSVDESITESFTLRMVVEFTDPALLVGVQAVQSNLIVSSDPVVMGFDLSGTNLQDIVPLESYDSMNVLNYVMAVFSDYENLDLGNMQPVFDYSMGILKNSHIDPVAAAQAAIKNFANRATTVIDNGSEKYYFAVNDDGSIVTDVPEGYVCGWNVPVSVFTEGQIVAPAITLYAGNAIIEANAEVILPTDSSVTILGATVSEDELMVGMSATVSVDVDNPCSIPYSLVFTTSDESVAMVDPLSGDILAVGPGVATIGVTIPGNNTVFVDVSVIVSVEGVTLDVDHILMDVGDSYVLVATVIPAQASDKNLLWVSDNTEVAIVSESGVVTAVGGGSTVITVITEDGGFTATCTVDVIVHVTDISLDKDFVQLSIGETVTLVPVILPEDATDKSVMWESDDVSIAIVDESGNITAVSAGITYIYATTVDGSCSTYCEVEVVPLYHYEVRYQDINGMAIADAVSGSAAYGETVFGELIDIPGYETPAEPKSIVISDDVSKNVIVYTYSYVPTPVSGVELNKAEMKLDVGKKSTLVATVLPTYAANKNVIWSSSDDSIVTVDQFGSVVAIAEGVATVTVTTVDGGFTATCEVTVPVHVKGVSLDMTSASVAVGSEFILVATVTPDNATNKAVSWSSSNKSVATVDENGNVVVKAPGKATITVITKDKSFIATCKIVAIADQSYVVNYVDEEGNEI